MIAVSPRLEEVVRSFIGAGRVSLDPFWVQNFRRSRRPAPPESPVREPQ